MSSSPLTPIVSAFDLTTSWLPLYQVPVSALRTGIDAVVFNNYSGANITYSFRVVQSGAGSSLSEIITNKVIRAGNSDLAPASIGQSVLTGGVIEAKCSSNNAVSVNITGTVINDDA